MRFNTQTLEQLFEAGDFNRDSVCSFRKRFHWVDCLRVVACTQMLEYKEFANVVRAVDGSLREDDVSRNKTPQRLSAYCLLFAGEGDVSRMP